MGLLVLLWPECDEICTDLFMRYGACDGAVYWEFPRGRMYALFKSARHSNEAQVLENKGRARVRNSRDGLIRERKRGKTDQHA